MLYNLDLYSVHFQKAKRMSNDFIRKKLMLWITNRIKVLTVFLSILLIYLYLLSLKCFSVNYEGRKW